MQYLVGVISDIWDLQIGVQEACVGVLEGRRRRGFALLTPPCAPPHARPISPILLPFLAHAMLARVELEIEYD